MIDKALRDQPDGRWPRPWAPPAYLVHMSPDIQHLSPDIQHLSDHGRPRLQELCQRRIGAIWRKRQAHPLARMARFV